MKIDLKRDLIPLIVKLDLINTMNDMYDDNDQDSKKLEEARNLLYDVICKELEYEYSIKKIDMCFNFIIKQNKRMEKYVNEHTDKEGNPTGKNAKLYKKILKSQPTSELERMQWLLKKIYTDFRNGNIALARNKLDYYKELLRHNGIGHKELLKTIEYEYSKLPDNRDTPTFIENNFNNTLYGKKKIDDQFWNMLLKCFYITNEKKEKTEMEIQEIDYKKYFEQQCLNLFLAEMNDIFKNATPNNLEE